MTDGGGGSEGLERPARPQRFETTSGIEIKPTCTPRPTPPTSTRRPTSAAPASPRSPGASTPRCTAAASGRCASTPASRRPRRRTDASATSSIGPDRPLGRVRPAHPDGLRLRRSGGQPARWDASACRSARSRTWTACSTGIPLGEVSTSMTINATAAILLALYVAVADQRGIVAGRPDRHRPERHPQGVHRARHLDLPAAPLDAPRDRRLRVRGRRAAPLEHDQHQRLPHARGGRDRGPGAGVHPCRRHRLRRRGPRAGPRRRRLRRPPLVLLRRLERAVRGGRQVPRRPADVGPDHARPIRRIEHSFDDVPLPRPDRRLVAHRPVDRQQRRAHDHPGPRRRPRGRPEPPHERARRGARAADRRGGPPRAADAADPRP